MQTLNTFGSPLGGQESLSPLIYDGCRTTAYVMTGTTWDNLGPREKQILAILRRADDRLTARDVLARLRDQDEDVAYTTVSTILSRLGEKGLVVRDEELHEGSTRYRHAFRDGDFRRALVDGVVTDVAEVLGDDGLRLLARRAIESCQPPAVDETRTRNRSDI
jgi:predicted transcriptional regulator